MPDYLLKSGTLKAWHSAKTCKVMKENNPNSLKSLLQSPQKQTEYLDISAFCICKICNIISFWHPGLYLEEFYKYCIYIVIFVAVTSTMIQQISSVLYGRFVPFWSGSWDIGWVVLDASNNTKLLCRGNGNKFPAVTIAK